MEIVLTRELAEGFRRQQEGSTECAERCSKPWTFEQRARLRTQQIRYG